MENTVQIDSFKAWCREHRQEAYAVIMAQAIAEVERERVNAYVIPIFRKYKFTDNNGNPITDKERLYTCPDEGRCMVFYAECDRAHRAHGFTGEEGYCPALIAEHDRTVAENALLDKAKVLFGITDCFLMPEQHERMLKLVLGACLNDEEGRKAA